MLQFQKSRIWLPLLVVASLSGAVLTTAKEVTARPTYVAPRDEDRTAKPRQAAAYEDDSDDDDAIRHPGRRDDNEGPPAYFADHDARETKDQPDVSSESGFVQPLDFNSFLSQVGNNKKDNLPIFAAASNNDAKNYFAGFFGQSADPLSSLSSSASTQNSKQHTDGSGFVDPNVQFRSLFDSAATATGFRPEDFLGSKDNSQGYEPSKGSQTRSFPSFTYTGRNDDGARAEGDRKQPAENRFRSSYRKIDSRNDDEDDRRQPVVDPYDDASYYDGEYDESPAAPPNPNPRYQQSQNRYTPQRFSHRQGGSDDDEELEEDSKDERTPTVQESSPAPKAKAAESKNGKCKKVTKEVDYNDDYQSYVDPEPDYDPSTYQGRYKRQANRGRSKEKRPMTCYVCEDEQGRHAERCSYDSKADPSKGSYFQSSSTSYRDNGRPQSRNSGRNREGSERYRRYLPTEKAESTTTIPTTLATAESRTDRNKRQNDYTGSTHNPSRSEYEFDDYSDFGFGQRNVEPKEPARSSSERRTEANPYHSSTNNAPSLHQSSTDRNVPLFDFGNPPEFNSGEVLSSSDKNFEFTIPKEFNFETHTATSNDRPTIRGSSDDDNFGLGDFSTGYDDYVKKYFPGAFGSSGGSGGGGGNDGGSRGSSTHSPRTPEKEHTQQSHSFAYPPYEYEDNSRHLTKMVGAWNQKDRTGCQKVNKGDMTCYVCRDAKGMNKEECMYAAADPSGRNTKMAYEESTEYSSPQATILRPLDLNHRNDSTTQPSILLAFRK